MLMNAGRTVTTLDMESVERFWNIQNHIKTVCKINRQ